MLSKQDLDFHRGLVVFGGIHLAWLAAGRNLKIAAMVIGLTVAGD